MSTADQNRPQAVDLRINLGVDRHREATSTRLRSQRRGRFGHPEARNGHLAVSATANRHIRRDKDVTEMTHIPAAQRPGARSQGRIFLRRIPRDAGRQNDPWHRSTKTRPHHGFEAPFAQPHAKSRPRPNQAQFADPRFLGYLSVGAPIFEGDLHVAGTPRRWVTHRRRPRPAGRRRPGCGRRGRGRCGRSGASTWW